MVKSVTETSQSDQNLPGSNFIYLCKPGWNLLLKRNILSVGRAGSGSTGAKNTSTAQIALPAPDVKSITALHAMRKL
jgi:hypothetical protein